MAYARSGQPKHFAALPTYAERVLPNLDIIFEGKEETRGLVVRMTKSNDYGTWRLFVDGVPIPNVPMTIDMDFNTPTENIKILDLYSKNLEVKDYYLGSTTLSKGKHTVRFELTGKNSSSSGISLGFDSFRLRERWLKKRASLN